MDSSLLSLLQTTDDRIVFLDELSLVSASLFSSDPARRTQVIHDQVRAVFAPVFQRFLSGPEDAKALAKLREEVLALPILRITLAFEPTPRQIEEYSILLRRLRADTPALLDIAIDPAIVGGAVITHNGKRFDYSLHTKISDYLLRHKDQILRRLQPYAQTV